MDEARLDRAGAAVAQSAMSAFMLRAHSLLSAARKFRLACVAKRACSGA